MKQLNQRLARLEGATIGKERLIIAVGPDEFDVDAEIARRGLEIRPADLVVAVHGKADGEPVTIKVDGITLIEAKAANHPHQGAA